MSEHAQLKDELEAMRQDNIQLVREHNHVKQACEELRRLHNDDQREVADMRMLQKQVPVESIFFAFLLPKRCSTWAVNPTADCP